MNKTPLWEIAVVTSPGAEDAVSDLLARVFNRPSASYTNEKTRVTTVSVYCPSRAEWTAGWRASLAAGLKEIRDDGLDAGAGRIVTRRVAREDWSESWKRHFKPIEIGSRLLIKPSWIKRRLRKNQAVVVLDPGLSFGTGNHPTTAFCLRELANGREDGRRQSCWDVGTGSGILAIAAVKLGYAPVRAFDFDSEAVRVARENARVNGVLEKVQISRQDINRLAAASRVKYDFICANLMADLLLARRKTILGRLRRGGRLVLAGILRAEFPGVAKAYQQAGLELSASKVEGEWRSGAFVWRSDTGN